MDWISLVDSGKIEEIREISKSKPVVIFKHSTRCSISASALGRLERSWNKEEMKDIQFYYLDLLNYRNISQDIAEDFEVEHQSPQILIISNEECVYHASHLNINYQEIKNQISKNLI